MLRDIQPDTVFVEGVLVGVEPLQIPPITGRLSRILVHRCILLVAENDAVAGPTFSPALAALGTLGFLLVACHAVSEVQEMQLGRLHFNFRVRHVRLQDENKSARKHRARRGQFAYQPVRDRIPKRGGVV